MFPDNGGPGERNLSDTGIANERITDVGTATRDDIENSGGEPRVEEALGDGESGERCGARGLKNNGVSRGESGCDLVQHEKGRIVERRNRDDDTNRLPNGKADLVETGAAIGVERK